MVVNVIRNYDFPDFYQQSEDEKGKWGEVNFSLDPVEDPELLICLNPPLNPIATMLPRERRWLVIQEPPVESYRWHKAAFPFFDKVFSQHLFLSNNIVNTQACLPWHICKSYRELSQLQIGDKLNKVSTITSDLNILPGHILRRKFINYLRKDKYKIDIFGKGINYIEDKFEGLYPYKYSLVVENSFYPHYWTEKIADCFLSWTMPIYMGCMNIEEYFPKGSIVIIDLNDFEKSRKMITHTVMNNLWGKNIKALMEARELVLNKYQFFPRMVNEINKSNLNSNYTRQQETIPSFSAQNKSKFLKSSIRGLFSKIGI
jgi:hypothetical protein